MSTQFRQALAKSELLVVPPQQSGDESESKHEA